MFTYVFLFTIISLLTINPSSAGIFYPINLLQPTEKKNEANQTSKENLPNFKLEGIVKGKETIVILDGKYLRKGDTIKGCLVKEIDAKKQSVTLFCKGLNIKLKLNLLKSEDVLDDTGKTKQ